MKEKIFSNLSLKILSIVSAIILWALIVNIYDPTKSITISNINVELINTENLTDKGFTYEVIDGSRVSVYISGPLSVITNIKASDIVATADLGKISEFADYVDIDVKVVQNGREVTNVEVSPRTTAVRLDIEKMITKEFEVLIRTTGVLGENVNLTGISVNPTKVEITAPAAVINSIQSVRVIGDLTGATSDITKRVPIVLFDESGNVIEDERISINVSEADFSATINVTKTVPVKVEGVTGKPGEGYEFSQVTANIDSVNLSGSEGVLKDIEEIIIPANMLDISQITQNKTFTIKLEDIIPEGVQCDEKEIRVSVKLLEHSIKNIELDLSAIEFTGLADGLYISIPDQTISVTLDGTSSVLSATSANIKAVADVSSLGQGSHKVSLKLSLVNINNCSIAGSYNVSIVIDSKTT